jgi:ABC-type antimicrobial peptide transport system permease subunit
VLAALPTTQLLRGLLFGISAIDVSTYVAVLGVLGIVALIAAWGAARHAARIDATIAMRDE